MEYHISKLLLIGIAIIVSYYFGEIARKLKLPSLTGYMVVGAIFGESLLNIFNDAVLDSFSFMTEIALGFVAFLIGIELNLDSLKKQGFGIIAIIFSESFFAFILVFVGLYALTGDVSLALIFGAMAPASAPAGTVAVIQEYKAKGSLTKALYAVVGFDDGLAIIIYGIAFAFAKSIIMRETTNASLNILASSIEPLREIGLSLVLGTIFGFIFCQLVRALKTVEAILIIVFGSIILITGLSVTLHISLILTNMMVGFVLVNTRRQSLVEKVSEQLNLIMPILFIIFFFLAGAHLQLKQLPHLGMIGLVYIFSRSAGLIGGARFGAVIGGVEEKIKKYLGLGILSQAGVAIGLALIVKHELERIGTPHANKIGAAVIMTITATSIFFEILGPILTKIALEKAGEITKGEK
ncbi:cation:proton antiporter [bacterium]|nr:cation:proton antiporter [bacterium]